MSTHNLCFLDKIRNIMHIPENPTFSCVKWGFPGYSLHGPVNLMVQTLTTRKYEGCSKINVSVILFRANRAMCALNHLMSIE